MNGLSEADRSHLDAFRQAARQVRDASIIDEGQFATVRGRRSQQGEMEIETELLGEEAFRSLAMSIRLVYQSNEPANFGHVCSILHRAGDEEARAASAQLRVHYNDALKRHEPLIRALARGGLDAYSPEEVFETWLYHGVFHQDSSRTADFEALSGLGDWFPLVVQRIGLLLAGRILDLDDVVADFLGEERVARIGA